MVNLFAGLPFTRTKQEAGETTALRSSSGDARQHPRGTTTEIAMMTDYALWSLLKDRGHEWAG